MADPDFDRIKRNISKMISLGAPEADIDSYVASESVTPEQLRASKTQAPKVTLDEPTQRATGSGALDLVPGLGEATRGIVRGATFGMSDEIAGAGAYLGRLIASGFSPTEAAQAYERTVSRQRERQKSDEQSAPVASTVGSLVGSAMVPIGAGLTGATMKQAVGRGAVAGAGLSGAYGFGEGEGIENRLKNAGISAAVGAVVGGAAPPIIRGGEVALRAGREALEGAANQVRGFRNPEGEAARRVTASLDRSLAAGDVGLSPNEFAAARNAGQPVVVADMGGEPTRALARSAVNTSPEGRAILNRSVDDRFEGQADRLTSWLRQEFKIPDTGQQREVIQDAARKANVGAYRQAYSDGAAGLWNPDLERLAGSPAVVDAMRTASRQGKDMAIRDGYGAFRPGVTVTDDGRVLFNSKPNGAPTYPDLQFWDYTYRTLRDSGAAAFRAGRNSEGNTLSGLARQLRDTLDQSVPTYAKARAGAASFFGAEDALDAGRVFVRSNMSGPDARRALAKMSPQEQALFKDGFLDETLNAINSVSDRRSVLNRIAETPAAREKFDIALGPNGWQKVEAKLRLEGIMDRLRPAVQGNSSTARQLAELGIAGATGAVGTGLTVGGVTGLATGNGLSYESALAALLSGAARRGQLRIDDRVSREVARLLTSQDPTLLKRGLQIVQSNKAFMDLLRSAEDTIFRATVPQVEKNLSYQ